MGDIMNMMKAISLVTVLGFAGVGCAGAGPSDPPKPMAKAKAPYILKGDQVEGCECESVCPCVFAHDVTFADCRGTLAWHIREGKYGSTDLGGISFAIVLTKSGKNVPKTMGTWEGVIYVSSSATPDQKAGVVDFLSTNWGKAFSKIDVRSEPIDFKAEGEKYEVRIGKVAMLKTAPLAGAGGKAPTIEHATFSLIPVLHCATTTENTYDDGKGTKWDFKDRNSFFGPFDYRGE
jgi:hypothetical protein